MSHYRSYAGYKASEVDCIGQVPEHWDVVRVARLGTLRKANGGSKEDNVESGVPCVRYGDLYTTHDHWIRHTPTFVAEEKATEYTPIRYGDVLFAASGETFEEIGKSAVNLLSEAACCGGDVILLRPSGEADPLFLGYALDCSATQVQKARMGKGFTVKHIYADELRNLIIALPPADEQRVIAASLDQEAARIDALIAKKTEFIGLLNKKRQALLTNAVTKGLDPKAKMRDSGVEWLGAVPAHWKVSKLGYEVSESGGKTPSTENADYWGGDVPWVTPKDMKVDVISDSIDKITTTAAAECGMATIPTGAVLAVVRGMILAHSFPVAETAGPVTINQDMKALVPGKNLLPTYLKLVLQSAKSFVVAVLVAEAAHGTRVLRTDIWRQLPMLLPPIEEQQLICSHVAKVVDHFAKLAALTKASIDLLKQRRSAIITAAVTGQIDLREFV